MSILASAKNGPKWRPTRAERVRGNHGGFFVFEFRKLLKDIYTLYELHVYLHSSKGLVFGGKMQQERRYPVYQEDLMYMLAIMYPGEVTWAERSRRVSVGIIHIDSEPKLYTKH